MATPPVAEQDTGLPTGGGMLISECPFCGAHPVQLGRYIGVSWWIFLVLTIGIYVFTLPFLPVKATCGQCGRTWIE